MKLSDPFKTAEAVGNNAGDMTDILERYRRIAAGFTARIEAVPAQDERWSQPSPCPEWTALDVVGHMVDVHHMFFGLIEHDVAKPRGGPLQAWTPTRDEMVKALKDPAIASKEYEGWFGRTRWEASVDRFVTSDILVHTWDLARALGVDDRLDPDEVRNVHENAKGFGDAMRQPGAFGPALEPPPDADEQEAMLSFLGRDPRASLP